VCVCVCVCVMLSESLLLFDKTKSAKRIETDKANKRDD
jgi:hypothetical protein